MNRTRRKQAKMHKRRCVLLVEHLLANALAEHNWPAPPSVYDDPPILQNLIYDAPISDTEQDS